MKITDMGITHSRGHAAIGDNPTNHQRLDPGTAQGKIHTCLIKGGIGHFFNGDIRRLQQIDERITPTGRGEITFRQKRP